MTEFLVKIYPWFFAVPAAMLLLNVVGHIVYYKQRVCENSVYAPAVAWGFGFLSASLMICWIVPPDNARAWFLMILHLLSIASSGIGLSEILSYSESARNLWKWMIS